MAVTHVAPEGTAAAPRPPGSAPDPGRPARRRARRAGSRGDGLAAWTMMLPALVLFTTFIAIPTVAALALSLYDWNFFGTPEWAGLEKYAQMLADGDTWIALGVTFEFMILGVVPTIVLGFLLAVLINVNIPGIAVLRVLYFVPVVVSVAVSSVLWSFLYDPRQGPGATILRALGVQPPDLLGSQWTATPALVLMMIWAALPIVIILYLAGLQRIPADIYSAASLDGAGPWRTLWSITWPNVRATTLVVAVLQVVNFAAGSLDLALIMTGGGPLGATRALGLLAFEQAFSYQDVGLASALSVLQLVVIVAIVAAGQLLIRRASR